MSIKKIATSAAVIASMLAAQMGPLAATAGAYERGHGYGYGDRYANYKGSRDFDRRDFGRGGRNFDNRGPRSNWHGHDRREPVIVVKKKDNTARTVAIGLGALMLGAILASEASRH